MKKIFGYMAFCLMTAIGLCACTEEEIASGTNNDRQPVLLKLSYQSCGNTKVDVAGRATDAENNLHDLHFYVFDTNGKLIGYKEMTGAESPGPREVTIRTLSGEAYIYAVANMESSVYRLSDADKALLDLEEPSDGNLTSTLSREQFLNIKWTRQIGENISANPTDNMFLMFGYINGGSSVHIVKGTDGSASVSETDKIIKLYRVMSKNRLEIKAASNKKSITFVPKKYELYNIPADGVLTNPSSAGTVAGTYYFGYKGGTFKDGSTGDFYLPENIQETDAVISKWKDREADSYSLGSRAFTNAPENASYMIIHGQYTEGNTTADVYYTIHLGNFSKSGALDNFKVQRNHDYTYKVTVNGVDDIIVEAEVNGNKENPYVEGIVIDASEGKSLVVDAHYEARVMEFKQSDIRDLKKEGKGYLVRITTPFGRTETLYVTNEGIFNSKDEKVAEWSGEDGIEAVSGQEFFSGERDYQWIRFVRNVNDNRIYNNNKLNCVCQYPGDNNEKAAERGNVRWVDVFHLLKDLYDHAEDDNDNFYNNGEKNKSGRSVYYTCFIDENYYKDKSWSEYTNIQEGRTMLLANDLQVSEDGHSLYAKVKYSIRQKSISTFYLPEMAGSMVAYGTENINEEEGKSMFGNGTALENTDQWKGYDCAVKNNKSNKWYSGDVENSKFNLSERQMMYSSIAKACMSRNRDLNGDGEIQENEVRWYLASVDHLRGLWFGRDALGDVDSWLISNESLKKINSSSADDRTFCHYYTSSKGGDFVFWAEEGLSTGEVKNGRANLVRCVRTLESNDEGLQDADLYYEKPENNNYTIRLKGMRPTRTAVFGQLGYHDELDERNGLSKAFVVASQDLSVTEKNGNVKTTWRVKDITGHSNHNAADPCSSYNEGGHKWRTPNQREMGLILSVGKEYFGMTDDACYGIKTDFSASGTGGWYTGSNGFLVSGSGVITVGSVFVDKDIKIRCVRDVE